jgi:hypothetical protein
LSAVLVVAVLLLSIPVVASPREASPVELGQLLVPQILTAASGPTSQRSPDSEELTVGVLASQTDPLEDEDRTCSDFSSQADAQLVLETDASDPFGLDLDLDGIACETPLVAPADRDAARERRAEREGRDREQSSEAATPVEGVPQDVDCVDFAFQEDAQAVYDHTPEDPHNLDPSGDGFACSSLPSRAAGAEDTNG